MAAFCVRAPLAGLAPVTEPGNRTPTDRPYHEAVLALYEDAGAEGYRVLRENGVLVAGNAKTKYPQIARGSPMVELMRAVLEPRLASWRKTGGLTVVMRQNRPGVSRTVSQVHARKNGIPTFWSSFGKEKAPVCGSRRNDPRRIVEDSHSRTRAERHMGKTRR